jgi:hypothetical protein
VIISVDRLLCRSQPVVYIASWKDSLRRSEAEFIEQAFTVRAPSSKKSQAHETTKEKMRIRIVLLTLKLQY